MLSRIREIMRRRPCEWLESTQPIERKSNMTNEKKQQEPLQ